MSDSSDGEPDGPRSRSSAQGSCRDSRRRGLKRLLTASLAGLGLPDPVFASPEPWTVDRWAGRPRRIARPRPDQPLPKRVSALDRQPRRNQSDPQGSSVQPARPDPVGDSSPRARGGVIERVHEDPLPGMPAVEHFEGRPPEERIQPKMQAATRRRRSGGQGMVELLIAAPVVLFAGLVMLQLALLMQARQALRLGALEAARAASVAHADPQAALQGLARGLAPWWAGAEQTHDALTAPIRTQTHLAQALALGRLRIRQLAPNEAAFTDWAVPATDDEGQPLAGQREIPNDALRIRSTETQPQTAIAGTLNGQPVGLQSGQTLLQANVLRLQIDYVVPLRVPIAGQAIALLAKSWQTDPELRRMSSAWGVPVRASVAVRMQTPARLAGSVSG